MMISINKASKEQLIIAIWEDNFDLGAEISLWNFLEGVKTKLSENELDEENSKDLEKSDDSANKLDKEKNVEVKKLEFVKIHDCVKSLLIVNNLNLLKIFDLENSADNEKTVDVGKCWVEVKSSENVNEDEVVKWSLNEKETEFANPSLLANNLLFENWSEEEKRHIFGKIFEFVKW